jgi:antitoxin VapB
MPTARIFKSGNSQAVRLPKEFRMNGPEVEIFKRGDEIVLREKRKGLLDLLDLFAQLPDDMEIDDLPQQERKGL